MLIYAYLADLGLAVFLVVLVVVAYFYVLQRWRMDEARREEIRRLTWLAAEEAERAEAEASELAYWTLPTANSFFSEANGRADNVKVSDGTIMQHCAVCYRHTTTRCSRCKAVRYCSGKCQIIHWRQGHKDNCHPPSINEQNNDGERSCTTNNANKTENHVDIESKAQPKSPGMSPAKSTEPTLQSTSDSCISSVSSSPSSSSCSLSSLSDDDFSSDDHHAPGSENINKNYIPEISAEDPILDHKHGQDASESSSVINIPCVGDKEHLASISSPGTKNIELEVHNINVIGQKMNYNGPDVTEYRTNGTINVQTNSVPAVADGTKGIFNNTVATPSCQASSKSNLLKTKSEGQDCSNTKGSPQSTTELNHSHYTANEKSTDVWLLKADSAKPASTISSVGPDSSFGRKQSAFSNASSKSTNITLLKNDSASANFFKSAETKGSAHGGASELKTSVRRVVQQLKPPNILKYPSVVGSDSSQKDKISFPYDMFVKLYNCDKVEMRPSGLINCGNSCYANAVLQCLTFTRPLASYLLQGLHSKICPKEDWCFTCEFESLLKKAKQGQSPLSPAMILSNIKSLGGNLDHGREEDAHEFLRYAVDKMQSVCLKAQTKAYGSHAEETTLINLMFGGYLHSKIKCTRCRGKSERHERLMDLTVEINGNVETLEEALALFTTTEILDGDNRYKCGRCKSYERAKKKLTILEAPNVLTIALKRFQSGKFGKLNKTVKFPEILNLAPYMHATDDKSPVYTLYAVVVHQDIMNATFSGHYVSYVRSAHGKWYKTDDCKVKPVDLAHVLSKNAYMLFYTRCSPRAPSLIRNAIHNDLKACRSMRFGEKLPFKRTSSYSDTSSIFSNSDEGSCSTRDSNTSTDELFGDSGRFYINSDIHGEENVASYGESLGWGRSRDISQFSGLDGSSGSNVESRKLTVDCRGRGSDTFNEEKSNSVLIRRVLPSSREGRVHTFY